MTEPRVPVSTYRLQITADRTLQSAAGDIDYLHLLGAGWVYLSPLLQAASGSDHGYDVTDHSRTDLARGGRAGLTELAGRAHAAGLGVLVDIVPNHVGVASPDETPWWWDLLTHGRQSAHAAAFDVEWSADGAKVLIPVLGDGDDALDGLQVVASDGDGPDELHYYDHRFPIAPGTSGGTPQQVHDRQHYRLVSWRLGDAELNYRRFFTITTLAGIRVELPEVMAASHVEIADWIRTGDVDGLRIDHPDGLADPGGYLAELAALTGGVYVVVEKILESGEQLPASWTLRGDHRLRRPRRPGPPVRRPGRRGIALRPRHRTAGRAGGLASTDPRTQAGRCRRSVAGRGAPPRPAASRAARRRRGRRRRRAPRLFPGVPQLSAARRRTPGPGGRRRRRRAT